MSAVDQLTAAERAADGLDTDGDPLGAESVLAKAVDAAAEALGREHPRVLAASCRLAALSRGRGELTEARRVLEAVIETGVRVHGEEHPAVLTARFELGQVAAELGNAYEARRHFDRLRRLGPAALGATHPHVLAAGRYLDGEAPAEPLRFAPVPEPEAVDPPPVPAASRRRVIAGAVAAGVLVALAAVTLAVRTGADRDGGVAGAPPAAREVPAATPAGEPGPSAPQVLPSAGGPGVVGAPSSTRSNAAAPATTAAGPRTFNGRYLIHPAHTGLCLGEGPELFTNTGRTVLGQHPCAAAGPPIRVEPAGGNTYRIVLEGSAGRPCATVDYDGTFDGLLLAGRTCADQANQRFTLEPVTAPAAGYRLRSASGPRYCIGVLEGKRQNGVQIMQDDCAGGAHEVFTLEAR